ncbi:MAG: M13 family metallopeptidase [Pseudobdellovibrionaceae bacterium]
MLKKNKKTEKKGRFKTIIHCLSVCGVAISASIALAADPKPSAATKGKTLKSDQTLQASDLYKGTNVPLKRSFPLNEKISPCEDFHQYVCGDVEKSFSLPKDRSAWTFSFSDNHERLLQAKKNYFKKVATSYRPKSERAQPMVNYYLACMNAKASAKEERQLVKSNLETFNKIQDKEALKDLLQKNMDQAGDASFAGFGIGTNQDDPDSKDVLIAGYVMSLPERSYYQDPEVMKSFTALAEGFFQTLGFKDFKQRAQQVIEFEKAFAQVYPLPAEMRQRYAARTYVPRESLITKYPELKFERILKRFPPQIAVRDYVPESLTFLNTAIKEKSLDELKNLWLFHQLRKKMDDAYPKFFAKRFALSKKLGGPAVRPVRQERCTKSVMAAYDKELDQELIPVLFPNFPKEKVVAVAEKVRASILASLEENKWLSTEARKEALRKISKATLQLVQPQNDKEWDFNPIITMDPLKPYANGNALEQALQEKEIQELADKRVREIWSGGPLTVNAYYSPPDNKFVLYLGILQFPFFQSEGLELENIAAIGSVVGHELGHSIDDQGSKYDADGKVRQWMSLKDLGEFRNRGSVFVEQFNKIGHNGGLTLGENIGDHVGLSAAYRTAFGAVDVTDKSSAAGATAKENKQKFFIAYARSWCEVMREETRIAKLKTGPHALGSARVNQQVIHLNGFYEAFSCSPASKMYLAPESRIKIW